MTKKYEEIILSSFVVDADKTFTLTEIRQRFVIDDKIIDDMLEHGLIEPRQQTSTNEIVIDQQSLKRMQTALHLYHDLGVNIAGSALVLEMLEELADLRRELDILQRHFD